MKSQTKKSKCQLWDSQQGWEIASFTTHVLFKAGSTLVEIMYSGWVDINFTAQLYKNEVLNPFPQSCLLTRFQPFSFNLRDPMSKLQKRREENDNLK